MFTSSKTLYSGNLEKLLVKTISKNDVKKQQKLTDILLKRY